MTAPVERLLAKLPGAKRNGRGWMARCPAHDDRRPSLSIAQGTDGRRSPPQVKAGSTTRHFGMKRALSRRSKDRSARPDPTR